jgi:hypothetical protein
MSIEITNFKHIVFLVDSKFKQHDGKIFSDIKSAREYISDNWDDIFYSQAVLGSFIFDPHTKESFITHIETIGFTKDAKKANQLDLFKKLTTI